MDQVRGHCMVISVFFAVALATGSCGGDPPGTPGSGENTSTNANANNTSPNSVQNNTASGGGGPVVAPMCSGDNCVCPDGLVLCGDVCVDVSQNTNHCGGCGESCGSGAAACVSGSCECAGSAVQCGDECVDLSTDLDHCGECERDCGDGETCVSGVCEGLQCNDGEVACDGGCVDISADPNNCGECGASCFDAEACQSGQCVCSDAASTCGAVGNQGTVVGGPCESGDACADGSDCRQGEEFPGGTCTTSCQADEDCPDQTACADENGGTCLLRCDEDATCRDGYECAGMDAVGGGDREVDVCIRD